MSLAILTVSCCCYFSIILIYPNAIYRDISMVSFIHLLFITDGTQMVSFQISSWCTYSPVCLQSQISLLLGMQLISVLTLYTYLCLQRYILHHPLCSPLWSLKIGECFNLLRIMGVPPGWWRKTVVLTSCNVESGRGFWHDFTHIQSAWRRRGREKGSKIYYCI